MDDNSETFGAASVVVFLAMFGGSTFILFLLCYFCQKKIHNEDLTVMEQGIATHQVYVIPTTNPTFPNVSAMPSPPPDYNSVIRKDLVFEFEADPPSYDTAVASLATSKCKSSVPLPEN